jgi:nitroreductase
MSISADNFFLRKSCRKYSQKPVTKDLLDKLIIAGRNAPSVYDF